MNPNTIHHAVTRGRHVLTSALVAFGSTSALVAFGSTSALVAFGSTPALFAQFGTPRELTEAMPTALDAILADMDGDGDLDALSTSQYLELDAWFENDGLGSFGARHVLVSGQGVATAALPFDLDGDGTLDVVRTSSDGSVIWLRGTGVGAFAAPQPLASFPSGFAAFPLRGTIAAADLDLDGDLDLVYGLLIGGVWVQANLGAGAFAAPTLVTSSSEEVYAVELADVNGDTLPEVLFGSLLGDRVTWLVNQGGLTFGPGSNLGAGLVRVSDLAVEDIDSDGIPDVVAVAEGSNRIVWFANTGAGVFVPAQTLTTLSRPWRLAFTDVDLDLDRDLVVSHQDLDGVVWYESQGGGAFGAPRTIVGATTSAGLAVGDVDGDGRVDVLAASNEVSLGWHRNVGGAQMFGPAQVFGASTRDVRDVATGDLDGDGDEDVAAASSTDDQLAWFEQLGGGSFARMVVLDSACAGCTLVRAVDLERDGGVDLVYAAGDSGSVYVRRNQGGVFGAREQVAALGPFVSDLELGDLDGDGDLDLVVAAGPTYVVRNLGATFAAPVALPATFSAFRVELGDIAGDLALDITTVEEGVEGSATVRFHRNLGGFAFSGPLTVASTSDVADLALADMDLDGDLDPAWVTSLPRRVFWAPNLGGSAFGPASNLGVMPDFGYHLRAADLDSDGDRDLLVGLGYDDDLQWYERQPGGFAPLRPVAVGGFVSYTTDVADLDGDGDLDVVFGSLDSDSVHWVPTDFDPSIGSVVCGPAVPNSTGEPGVIWASGSALVAANDLVLTGRQLPVGAFGYFLVSLTPSAPTPVAGSAGRICLGGAIGRMIGPGQVLQASTTGTVRLTVGTQSLPQSTGPIPVTPGQTWHFQLWHRDQSAAGASNFSNAVRVLFL